MAVITHVFTTTGFGSWTVPSDIDTSIPVTIVCIGGGGGSDSATPNGASGGGGGGVTLTGSGLSLKGETIPMLYAIWFTAKEDIAAL